MELSGHPTDDLVAELVERGAVVMEGDDGAPGDIAADEVPSGGRWLWLPDTAYETDLDEPVPSS